MGRFSGKTPGPIVLALPREFRRNRVSGLVEGVDHDDFWDAVLGGAFPDRVGADAHAVLGVNHHQGKVADAQGRQGFADEISTKIARTSGVVFPLHGNPRRLCLQ
jgi:hypothetical protein